MKTMIWVAVLVVLALLVIVMIKKQKSVKTPDLYVCSHCGEKDCECAKQENSAGRP